MVKKAAVGFPAAAFSFSGNRINPDKVFLY